jgi:prepilin-type N-terminal cleavage/methylation domain-containing protein
MRKRMHKTGMARPDSRSGFVLLEVIIAMFILGLVLSSLAALMYQVSRRSFLAIGGAYRNGVLLQEVNRMEALPYDSLAVGTASVSVTALPYVYTRTTTITNPSTNAKTVELIIAPSNILYKPDTAIFTRTLGATTTTFNQ